MRARNNVRVQISHLLPCELYCYIALQQARYRKHITLTVNHKLINFCDARNEIGDRSAADFDPRVIARRIGDAMGAGTTS